ncbi:hypothetical protein DFH06DRAFT_1171864 [Mycena polygramma]|nr:hypothetical protein DFH06DRAFT_1171864 [Mycena polygramma]
MLRRLRGRLWVRYWWFYRWLHDGMLLRLCLHLRRHLLFLRLLLGHLNLFRGRAPPTIHPIPSPTARCIARPPLRVPKRATAAAPLTALPRTVAPTTPTRRRRMLVVVRVALPARPRRAVRARTGVEEELARPAGGGFRDVAVGGVRGSRRRELQLAAADGEDVR